MRFDRDDDAACEHLELMFAKPDFGRFLVAAAATHTPASLGVIGETLHEAMASLPEIFTSTIDGDHLILAEQRSGSPRLGSLLVSDYAMLVAAHVIRESARERPHPIAMESRRATIDDDERRCYEAFLGTRVHAGQPRAALVYDRSVLELSITHRPAF